MFSLKYFTLKVYVLKWNFAVWSVCPFVCLVHRTVHDAWYRLVVHFRVISSINSHNSIILYKDHTRVIQKVLPPPSDFVNIKASHIRFVTFVALSLSYTFMVNPIRYYIYFYPYTVKTELRFWTTETRKWY